MYYKDQLVLTGALNDVGDPMMMNVDNSYRTGIELESKIIINPKLSWEFNAAFSKNKITAFTNHVQVYDQDWNLTDSTAEMKNKTIAFSPSFVVGSDLSFCPINGFILKFQSKYVSKQYLDNTQSNERKLNQYFVNNFLISYDLPLKFCRKVEFNFLINNLFNTKYVSNGWVSPYIFMGQEKVWDGYFPQAGINFLGGITLRF